MMCDLYMIFRVAISALGTHEPVVAFEKHGLKIMLHFAAESPHPSICVVVASFMNYLSHPLVNFNFQVAVTKVQIVHCLCLCLFLCVCVCVCLCLYLFLCLCLCLYER